MKNFLLSLTSKLSIFFSKILIWRYKFKIITVAGSIGKTSTKYVIGDVLNYKIPTIYQKGSYNQPFSIPFALFGLKYPDNPKNIFAWMVAYTKMLSLIIHGYKYKIAVLEVGTDMPGEISRTTNWLKADVAVLTGIQQEHMQNFKDLDQVAKEELNIFKNAKFKFISSDSVNHKFIEQYGDESLKIYGFSQKDAQFNPDDLSLVINLSGDRTVQITSPKPAEYLNQAFIIATQVADQVFKFSEQDLKEALSLVNFPAGRMNIFGGINNSTIIDDSYNASPEAYQEALSLIYSLNATRIILVIGNMNEFGAHSARAHKNLAKLIKLNDKDIIVTIGADANSYLFPELKKIGIKNLFKFNNPWDVGEFLISSIKKDDLVFLKGSQNGVFLEEAVKMILKDPEDSKKLCRQSESWQQTKLKFKGSFKNA